MSGGSGFEYVRDWHRKRNELGWWHSFELPDGTVLQGVCGLEDLKRRLAQFPIPQDLTGKRVLDIGAWDGFFSFELEKRGAEVVAIDCWDNERFRLMREMLGSRVDYRILDMYELTPERIGRFDIVVFFGVLYHLKHPLLALERVCALATDLACVDTFVSHDDSPIPRMEFYEHVELGGQTDNWVGPNLACLLAFCRTAGFARVEFRSKLEYSACVACYRHWEPATPDAPEGPKIEYVFHERNFGINFRSDVDDYVAATFAAEEASTATVKPEVGGFGVTPMVVTPIGGGLCQANFKLPPGLTPGWHEVTIRLAGSRPSAPHRIAVDLAVVAESIRIASITASDTWQASLAARGKWIVIWVEGLPENSDIHNTSVTLQGRRLRLSYASNGQVNAAIPDDLVEGEHTLTLSIGSASDSAVVTVV